MQVQTRTKTLQKPNTRQTQSELYRKLVDIKKKTPTTHEGRIKQAIEQTTKPRYRNVSMRETFYGGLGSGKTLCAVRSAEIYHYLNPKSPIYSNVPINAFKTRPLTSLAMLLELNEPCFVLGDEWWHVNDSRKSLSIVNDVGGTIMLRSRKGNWFVVFTEQWWTQLDLRIRFVTDIWGEPTHYEEYDVIELQYFNKHGVEMDTVPFDAEPFYRDYISEADPLTLDLEQVKAEYDAYLSKKRATMTSEAYRTEQRAIKMQCPMSPDNPKKIQWSNRIQNAIKPYQQ